MQPTSSPPPNDSQGIRLPLLINGGLLLLTAALAYAGNDGRSEALLVVFLAMAALTVFNVVALVIAALARKGQWITGFALSVGLLLLVGLGTCGLMVA